MKPDIVSKACLNDRLRVGWKWYERCFGTIIVNVDSAAGSRHNAIVTGENLVRHTNRTTRGRSIAGLEDTDPVPPSSYGSAREILT